MSGGAADPAAVLRRAGLRVTASRLAVLTALSRQARRIRAPTRLVSALRERLGDGSAQTVYNVLRTLTDAGLVRRIEPAGTARPVRAARRRQPPPHRVPHVRRHRRRRLRRRRNPVPDCRRQLRL